MKSILPPIALAVGLGACGDNLRASGPPDAGVDAAADPPVGLTFFDYLIAVDVTPDGRTALFETFDSTTATAIFVDTVTGTAKTGPAIGDPSRAIATGIAANGRISALHDGAPTVAGVWSEESGWNDLGSPFATPCDLDEGGAFDISADGEVAVGLVWDGCAPAAFRWSEAGGFSVLEVLGTGFEGGAPSNRATVISDDGRIAAGFAQDDAIDRKPALWRADGSGVLLAPSGGDAPGEVLSISADGSTVAGINAGEGFVWTEGAGMVPLPRPEIALPTDPMFPNAMTADGTRIFGGVGDAFFGVPQAFVWTTGGTRLLADVVAEAGLTVPEGTILGSVLGASADGSVLIGTALDAEFATKTFLLVLPQ